MYIISMNHQQTCSVLNKTDQTQVLEALSWCKDQLSLVHAHTKIIKIVTNLKLIKF